MTDNSGWTIADRFDRDTIAMLHAHLGMNVQTLQDEKQ